MRSFSIFALALAAAFSLAACAKGSGSSNTTESSSAQTTSAAATMAIAKPSAGGNGARVYQANCSSCHQADGKGLLGSFPPLAGNAVVTGDPKAVIHIVKYGLTGKIDVQGHTFNGIMPPWGSQLSNADIAAALTYVRSSWGNKASLITEAQVASTAK